MMDLAALASLRAVDTHGSVVAAADALGFTPSAVSQQVKRLERQKIQAAFKNMRDAGIRSGAVPVSTQDNLRFPRRLASYERYRRLSA